MVSAYVLVSVEAGMNQEVVAASGRWTL